MVSIPRFTVLKEKPTAFTLDECLKLIHAAGKHRLLITTLLFSGLRATELSCLRYTDVADGKLLIRAAYTKNSHERHVTIPDSLVRELRAHRSGSDRIFPFSRHGIYNRVRKVTKRAGLGSGWTHKLRSTYATTLLQAGVDVASVAHQLGHLSLQPTIRYLDTLGDKALQQKITSALPRIGTLEEESSNGNVHV
ncbi:MAG TPA: site-specific integrase [Terriglobales bacterium]|nr:site-specific integrase [Terriglobales bacterium]